MATRLQEKYKNEVVPELVKIFGFKNAMQAPQLKKIVLNDRSQHGRRGGYYRPEDPG